MPSVLNANPAHLKKIFGWKKYTTEQVGSLFKIPGFTQFNTLIDIDQMFNKFPQVGIPVNRASPVLMPIECNIRRGWQVPSHELTLEQALEDRVRSLSDTADKINICWSGGIDSTTVLTAFLKYSLNHQQLRILYTPCSVDEHPEYITFLEKKFPEIEKVNISAVYLDTKFDGIFVTGHPSDEMHARLNESFFTTHGYAILMQPWETFFRSQGATDEFIEQARVYFSQAGRPINTVLDARWWFYVNSRLYCIFFYVMNFWVDHNQLDFNCTDFNRVQGFFDCASYENYIFYNIDRITGNNYEQWKQPLKDFCYAFDQLEDYQHNKYKIPSSQFRNYRNKKRIMKKINLILLIDSGERIYTPSLPLLTQLEFNEKYANRLDYLFNEPDKI